MVSERLKFEATMIKQLAFMALQRREPQLNWGSYRVIQNYCGYGKELTGTFSMKQNNRIGIFKMVMPTW